MFFAAFLLLGDPTKDLHAVEPSPFWTRQVLVFCEPARLGEVVRHCERLGFTVVDLAMPEVRDGQHYLTYHAEDAGAAPLQLYRRVSGPCLLLQYPDRPDHPRLADVVRHPAVREVGHVEHSRYDPPRGPRVE